MNAAISSCRGWMNSGSPSARPNAPSSPLNPITRIRVHPVHTPLPQPGEHEVRNLQDHHPNRVAWNDAQLAPGSGNA